ncbi:autotransporter outer membrane beta-barrel domain-containing protein [Yersinia enterocolitica]|uniref:autotransporter outer membrane beta-barrel domain-containing protein n=1 Tax=Yersinia enterocolitica TaxID=630 RepID=UPI0030D087A1
MYISNIIQPNGHPLTQSISSNHAKYRLSPCAKAIGALLLVFGSNLAEADVYTEKKTNTQHLVEHRKDVKKWQQMWQHKQYLLNDLLEVEKKQHQLQSPYDQTRMESLPEEVKQKLKPLKEKKEYLERQLRQHQHNLQQVEWELQQKQQSETKSTSEIKPIAGLQYMDFVYMQRPQPPKPSHFDVPMIAAHTVDIATNLPDLLEILEVRQQQLNKEKTVVKPTTGAATNNPIAKTKTAPKAPSSPQKKAPAPKVIPKPAPIIGHNPQVGSYIANQIAAQQMFITDDLQYRQGETRYIDPVTGEEKVSSLWLNTLGAKNRFNSGNDQLRTKSNRYVIQLGGTLNKWGSGGDDQGILGMTAGFGKSTNYSHSTSSQHQAQGSVDGYNLGLYSIWYANNQTRLGPYIDLLVQYGWFNNQIKAPNVMTAANYKSYLFTSALETGYKIQLLETADTKLSLQPRVKVMWQRTSGLLHKEPNAILINVEEDNAVTTKLGMRTVFEFDIDTLSSVKNLQINPSFEAHWIHSRINQGVQLSRAYTNPRRPQDEIELASVNVSPQGNNNIADLKLGIEANIDRNLRLWTYLGHQFGGHNYSDTQATVGMNYRF